METIITCPTCGARNRLDPHARSTPVCGRCKSPLQQGGPGGAPGNGPVTVTDDSFAELVAQSRVPILLDLWAPWCGPCRMLAPTLEQLASEFAGKIVVAKMNIDENPSTAGRFRVDSIPTLLLFKNGQMVQRLVGLQPKQALQQALRAVA